MSLEDLEGVRSLKKELGKVSGGGEGPLKVPWSLGGADNPEGPVVKGIGSSGSFFCSFKLNLNQENVSKLLERAWNEGGEGWRDLRGRP